MFVRLLLTSLFLMLPIIASGQTRFLEDPAAARKAADAIVGSLSTGNIADFIKELRPLMAISSADFDVFEAQVKSQQASFVQQFGEVEGYEFLREEEAGSHLMRLQYLVLHKKTAIRLVFVFYRSNKGWFISHVASESNAFAYFPALVGGA